MHFEKVSLDEFKKAAKDCDMGKFLTDEAIEILYEKIKLPKQGTASSAGMDMFMPFPSHLKPGENLIPLGIRWVTDEKDQDKVLSIYPRSGHGFKYRISLANTVGIIDADYCNADNEGHIKIKLYNPKEEDVYIGVGKGICQGIVTQYFICEGAESDDSRTGGFGSTDKKEKS